MDMDLKILHCGSCEGLKTGVHALALALAAVMGAYNAAAWLRRRQTHLGINAVLYAALFAWEQQHVVHHLAEMRIPRAPATEAVAPATPPLTIVDDKAA
ncbi:MAG TPA: hypothetical protein VGJ29_14410 [Vicinamibacterales bacterium]|jgi:hypothetical protein